MLKDPQREDSPNSDLGEAAPQITHEKRSCCKLQEDFYFKSALRPTVIHHAGVEDRGMPSSWGRGYLKEKKPQLKEVGRALLENTKNTS